MPYNPQIHHRQSIRLQGYDYSAAGAYFVTICTHNRECMFGEIVDAEMILNDAGRVAEACWQAIPDHFPQVELDAYIIMPNHVHGIVVIGDDGVGSNDDAAGANDGGGGANVVGAKNFSPLHSTDRPRGTSKTIGSIVRGFKIGVTKWARQHTDVYTVWQRNYYEHIIRDENELNRIRQYIVENPRKWELDRENREGLRANDDSP